tara:strand:- start:2600 stop:3547 length:948 start_codon:yes stop_codon:yes gene_type:complete
MKFKFFESSFDEYINRKNNLHPNIQPKLKNIENTNIIFYGPSGTGKYTQSLDYIKKYSPSNLKYERKLNIQHNKKEYIFKISDIHFEVDMQLLGCNAKILWNIIYNQIIDIISARESKKGIILCKNFQFIHSELLDIFYSYMQTLYHMNINIDFVILTNQVSFLPSNILNRCLIIPIKRPTKTSYNKCLKQKIPKSLSTNMITNIKLFKMKEKDMNCVFKNINNVLLKNIINYKEINYLQFRDRIYDMFIYQLDISECIWYIIKKLIEKKYINQKNNKKILLKISTFLKYFNNNYRPIYHMESLFFFIIKHIHNF